MKILFLDDDAKRHNYFQQKTIGHDVCRVMTADHAIKALQQDCRFDVVCLDHDLGGEQMVRVGTIGHGLEVARWIAEHPERKPHEIVIIHSYNPMGAMAMYQVLVDADVTCAVIPFGPGLIRFLGAC